MLKLDLCVWFGLKDGFGGLMALGGRDLAHAHEFRDNSMDKSQLSWR